MALSTSQSTAVELLADPYNKLTKTAIAKKLGVRRETIWAWTKKEEFNTALNTRINEFIISLRASALACLQRNIESGDVAAARSILQVSGDIGSGTNIVTNVTQNAPEQFPDRLKEWMRERAEVED